MFIDHATAHLRTDAAWPDLYAWYGRTLAILYDQVAPRLRHELDRAEAVILPTDESAGEQST
jgi:hypothetical protein